MYIGLEASRLALPVRYPYRSELSAFPIYWTGKVNVYDHTMPIYDIGKHIRV